MSRTTEHGDFRAMPALGGGHALLKWVTSFPGTPQGPPHRHGPRVALRRGDRGTRRPARCGRSDGASNGGGGVIAAETLCRAGAETTAVIGCGVNGAETARMFRALGGDVQVWDLDPHELRSWPTASGRPSRLAGGGARVRHRRHRDARTRAALPARVASPRAARLDDGSGRPRQGRGGGRGARRPTCSVTTGSRRVTAGSSRPASRPASSRATG